MVIQQSMAKKFLLLLPRFCDRFQILESSNRHLHARLDGRQSGGWVTHIKAATFHDLAIKQTPEGLEATIVFDV
jgi:SHS2 domain-containing protein